MKSQLLSVSIPTLNAQLINKIKRPERILMFGTGGFLRGFASAFVHEANERGDFDGSIVMVQSTQSSRADKLTVQDGLFTVLVKGVTDDGIVEEEAIIESVSRALIATHHWFEIEQVATNPNVKWVISNTTEKGLTLKGENPNMDDVPVSFPGKLCKLMYKRFLDQLDGFIILPCELLSNNGNILHDLVVTQAKNWGLSSDFIQWVETSNQFCSTLVDRIIPGDPEHDELIEYEKELGYKDDLITVSEKYRLWAIEGNRELYNHLPFIHNEKDVIVAPDISLYAIRKLRLLNATHTIAVPYMILKGHATVVEMMNDSEGYSMIETILLKESGRALTLPEKEVNLFSQQVINRFKNPFLKHELQQIAFQSTLKWKNRVLPLLLAYVDKFGELPIMTVRGLAGLIRYNYAKNPNEKQNGFFATFAYEIADEQWPKYQSFWNKYIQGKSLEIVNEFLSDKDMWSEDLSQIPGLGEAVHQEIQLLEQSVS